jgi:hypothetical protein
VSAGIATFEEALSQIVDAVIEFQEQGKLPDYSKGKREYRNKRDLGIYTVQDPPIPEIA